MSQPFESNPRSNNPFSPPQAMGDGANTAPASKPSMATVFGILNLVFGGLSLLGQAFGIITIFFLRSKIEEMSQQSIPMPGVLQWIGTAIQLLLTFWLIYSGIRVLGGTMSGRATFITYCLGSLLIRPFLVAVNLFAQYDQMQQQIVGNGAAMPPEALIGIMVVGGLFAFVLAEVYEAVAFFVIRSKNVTQQFQAWDEVVNGQRPNESFNFK